MIIIKHKGGWSASNSAEVNSTETPHERSDTGRIISFKSVRKITVDKPYTVSGELSGEVQCAIKDDVSGEVLGFSGVYLNGVINDISDNPIEWLKSIR